MNPHERERAETCIQVTVSALDDLAAAGCCRCQQCVERFQDAYEVAVQEVARELGLTVSVRFVDSLWSVSTNMDDEEEFDLRQTIWQEAHERTAVNIPPAQQGTIYARGHDASVAAATIGRAGGLKGGLSTSEKKQAAVRNNGQKGGRPRRTIRVRNIYTGQAFVLCVRHEKANVVGSSVHEMVGDVQVQGPGPDGACEACEAGIPDGNRAGVAPTMAQRCNIPEAIAQRLRELVVGGDARSRSRHLELLRNEVRRVLLGDRLRGPNRTLPGGMTTRQIVSILQQEGLL